MMKGSKRVEYRTRFRKRATVAAVYVSSPVKEIKAFLFLGKPVIDAPANLVKHINNPESAARVYDYLKKNKKGYAIPIEGIMELPQPIPLAELKSKYNFIAPQSYAGLYLYPELYSRLLQQLKLLAPDVRIIN